MADVERGIGDRGGPDGPTPRFVPGSTVEWAGPVDVSRALRLQGGHPGVVATPDPMSVIVRWVDRVGWFDHTGVFQQEWLEPISQQEFDRRVLRLRQSDWPGFPPGEY